MDPTTFQETPQLAVDEPVIPKVGYIISRYTRESTAPGLSLPRWHCDGVYFGTQKDQHFKFVTTLLGPGTIFLKNGVEARSIEREEGTRVNNTLDSMEFENDEGRMKERRRLQGKQRMNLVERLDEWERVQPGFGECAR